MQFLGERPPRRPVIASLASAAREFNHWVGENAYHELTDRNGALWRLTVREQLLPHPESMAQTLYRLTLGLQTLLNQKNLVETGVLDAAEDARLLGLIGADTIPIRLRERVLEASQIEEIRREFAAELDKIREYLKKHDLNAIKKRLVGRWIDRRSFFGHRLLHDNFDLEV